jgi:hypothetical protein
VNCSVNGVPGGNFAIGTITSAGIYTAPADLPSPAAAQITATSQADSTKSGNASLSITSDIRLSLAPNPASVELGATQIFQAQVVSSDDTAQSGLANVTISSGVNIAGLLPSSVYAGASQGFTLRVTGSGFVPSSPGPGSTLLIGGASRVTTCASPTQCTAPVTAVDVALAGSVSVQVHNPGGVGSNTVALIVAAPNVSDEVIALTSGAPAATGKDIVVVEPTTAGVSVPGNDVDLNVGALGPFNTAGNACTLGGSAISPVRPASGTATSDICIFSQSGLDTSMTYTVSGPGDVTVIAKQPAGLGIIHLTLQIPASAAAGARTLFIQNLDKTAASGVLEVH